MSSMPLRATVRNGRLVLDEPTDLPEGTVLELVPVEENDIEDAHHVNDRVDETDAKLLRGEPAPLIIRIPVVIEE